MNHKIVAENRDRIEKLKKAQINYPMTKAERNDLENHLRWLDSAFEDEEHRSSSELIALLEILAPRIRMAFSRESLIKFIWKEERS